MDLCWSGRGDDKEQKEQKEEKNETRWEGTRQGWVEKRGRWRRGMFCITIPRFVFILCIDTVLVLYS